MSGTAKVQVRASHGGHGVFTLEALTGGQRILEFVGPACDRDAVVRAARDGAGDGFLQIARDSFYALSGGPDDFVNHSCAPNAYVRFDQDGVFLVARAAIAAGEELYFDYGVTQIEFPFRFDCLCGATECRGPIGNCDELPAATLATYRAAGMVPAYIEEELRRLGR